MYEKNSINYERIFNRWVRLRRINTFVIFFIIAFSAIFYIPLIWQTLQESDITLSVVIFSLILIPFMSFFSFQFFYTFKSERIKISKEAIIYTAIVSADELKGGNQLKAALSLRIMLFAISDYLSQRAIKLGEELYSPIKFARIYLSLLLKRNLSFYIQNQCDTSELKFRLHKITSSLVGNDPLYYIDICNFLTWLGQDTKDAGDLTESFTEKHPLLTAFMLPIITVLGIIATIVIAVTK